MYLTYLRRERSGRKKQTAIVASGLAVAIALVIVVSTLAAGVSQAQEESLESVYGVGTDLTVTGGVSSQEDLAAMGDPGSFAFDGDEGDAADGTRTLSQNTLSTERGRTTLDASTVDTVAAVEGVTDVAAALELTNQSFSGEIADFEALQEQFEDLQGQVEDLEGGRAGAPPEGAGGGAGGDFAGGPDGAGGSAFNVSSFSVLGVDLGNLTAGPLSAVEVTEGRALTSDDAGASVILVDSTYAATNEIAVGDSVEVGGESQEVVGIVQSASDTADTAADVFMSLDTAQTLAGVDDVVSTLYVTADSATSIDAVSEGIAAALPEATVTDQSELAESVSGSLATAASLITDLGRWLSIVVLGVAVVLAVLFTISGVARRTREFGTLKAIGWSNGRVVGQVAGESVVQGAFGGVVGLALGLVAVLGINLANPTIAGTTETAAQAGPMGGPGGFQETVTASADVVLNAPLSVEVIALAVALAIGAGLVAGAFGGLRAAMLRPAQALRSID